MRGARVSARSGRSTSIPAFIALAAISTWGTKSLPVRKSSPTTSMPAMRPWVSASYGVSPRRRSSWTPATTGSAFPP